MAAGGVLVGGAVALVPVYSSRCYCCFVVELAVILVYIPRLSLVCFGLVFLPACRLLGPFHDRGLDYVNGL